MIMKFMNRYQSNTTSASLFRPGPMWPRLARRSLASADVAIVGAGPSGLAACKAALEEIHGCTHLYMRFL